MAKAKPLTVGLTSTVATELEQLCSWTGLSKTELVNRSIRLHHLMEEGQRKKGRKVAVYDPNNGEFEVLDGIGSTSTD